MWSTIIKFLTASVIQASVYQQRVKTVKDLSKKKTAIASYSALIDLVTVFDAILTSRQTRVKLQCLYENLTSNNFRKTAVLKKNMICKLKLYS